MPLTITTESPLSVSSRALIDGSEQALRSVYSSDECFTFSADELDAPEITFLVANNGSDAVGCVALVNCGTYGEVKRLFVSPAARGTGTAKALMDALETCAARMGLPEILLETGDKLAAAVSLYSARGYVKREKFGPYEDHPASLFMAKRIA
ncbi:GNAT family N-acetyltransferase [Thalassovita sp.]|uniref:GNAT family N-acetyltransferase n=1 Tax=Thalassovita sp. TaxID=1979401 RepID=UPI002881A202|nr:GNAT family N-acetyltransferase [Thalassovita sp.]MDF1803822.1 GNAT family N-acetyltransferase [Thalassovita sp.]